MKAICLHEPWATLMAIGVKRNETRAWPWDHRGDVVICATRQCWRQNVPEYAIPALQQLWDHRNLFSTAGFEDVRELYLSLPFGHAVCIVRKTGCVSTDGDNGDDRSLTPTELACGDYSPHRYYYPTTDCRRLYPPIPVLGQQGVWELSPTLATKVLASLRTPDYKKVEYQT